MSKSLKLADKRKSLYSLHSKAVSEYSEDEAMSTTSRCQSFTNTNNNNDNNEMKSASQGRAKIENGKFKIRTLQ